MLSPVRLAVTEPSQVGEARRVALALAGQLGFDPTEAGRAALVVTEAANNLVKHARDGEVLLRPLEDGEAAGIEVLALDRGPGMADVARCLADGHSTAGSPGTGLGALGRLSDFLDVYSRQPTGTALVARLWPGSGRRAKPSSQPATGLRVGAVSVPKNGEEVCGDAWAVAGPPGRVLALVADGLGHGVLAGEAAGAAVRVFEASTGLAPAEILQAIHRALHATRGAAVSVAELDLAAEVVRYAGVGNVAGTVLVQGASRSLVSHNGTLGHEARKFQEFTAPFPRGATLVMHSDGLGSRWDLATYPGLAVRDPALIAGVLYRDFARGRDDVTVLAVREGLP